jgi:hypothetical protein
MKYRVVGADAETGGDVTMTIEAKDGKHAEQIAAAKKVYIRAVMPDPEVIPPPLPVQSEMAPESPATAVLLGLSAIGVTSSLFCLLWSLFERPTRLADLLVGIGLCAPLAAMVISMIAGVKGVKKHIGALVISFLILLVVGGVAGQRQIMAATGSMALQDQPPKVDPPLALGTGWENKRGFGCYVTGAKIDKVVRSNSKQSVPVLLIHVVVENSSSAEYLNHRPLNTIYKTKAVVLSSEASDARPMFVPYETGDEMQGLEVTLAPKQWHSEWIAFDASLKDIENDLILAIEPPSWMANRDMMRWRISPTDIKGDKQLLGQN